MFKTQFTEDLKRKPLDKLLTESAIMARIKRKLTEVMLFDQSTC